MDENAGIQERGEKEVPTQLDRLGMLLEELDKGIHSLEEQLKPVLRTDDLVKQDGQDEMKVQQLVPLANLLREQCKHTEAIIEHVSCLHQGLQI